MTALGGCTVGADPEETTNEFVEALPGPSSVSVDGPELTTGGNMSTAAGSRGTLDADPTSGTVARWYSFTRDVRDGVNVVTAVVLVSVWAVVHTAPSEIGQDQAIYGPFEGDALDPARYRLTLTRIGEHHFRYLLEGQAKAGGGAAHYLPVLDGDGYSRASDLHGDGRFTLNLDNAKALDPSRHSNDSGTLTIEHDLPADIGQRADALPRRITATAEAAGGEWLQIRSSANEDRTGSLGITGVVGIDAPKKGTALEDVSIESRRRATGAGRSDIAIGGGDLPAAFDPVTAVECWGSDFSRVYYDDSVGLEPPEGSAAECAYDAS